MAGTGLRNGHRVGDYLMLDDESGFAEWRSNMLRIWDGTYRRRDQFETRQPQEFVYARNDPKALRHVRPEPDVIIPVNAISGTVGDTNVPSPTGPAAHLFPPGIGGMIIEGTNTITVFRVR